MEQSRRFHPYFQNSIVLQILSGSFVLGWLVAPPELHRQEAEGSLLVRVSRTIARALSELILHLSNVFVPVFENSLFVRGLGRLRNGWQTLRASSLIGRFINWWSNTE